VGLKGVAAFAERLGLRRSQVPRVTGLGEVLWRGRSPTPARVTDQPVLAGDPHGDVRADDPVLPAGVIDVSPLAVTLIARP
jgi:hypothetical protein